MKIVYFFTCGLGAFLPLMSLDQAPANSWQQSLIGYKAVAGTVAFAMLQKQYQLYVQGNAPKIADLVIKNIPIRECYENVVDIGEMGHARITMLPAPAYVFASPECHSGFATACKIRFSLWVKLQEMVKQLDIFAAYFGYQEGQIDIKVFEGLRDIATQQVLFDNKVAEIQATNPAMSQEEVLDEASKWVSPVQDNIPVHSTGAAVDIRLWDNKSRKFIDMGPFGVIWGKNEAAPTFSDNVTATQRNNRLYQLIAAATAGLTNYVYEYWHFSYGDRYASYWQEPVAQKRYALYGSL